MIVTVKNIKEIVGHKVTLLSVPKESFHYMAPYMDGIIGSEVEVVNDLGVVKLVDGNTICFTFGFEVEPKNTTP